MRRWLARHDEGCFYITLCALLLGIFEYLLIHRFITDAPHGDLDVIIVVFFAAPLAAGVTLFIFMLAGWILTRFISERESEEKTGR